MSFEALPKRGSSVELYRRFVQHNKSLIINRDKKQTRLPFKRVTREERLWNEWKADRDRKTTEWARQVPLVFPFGLEEEAFIKELGPLEPLGVEWPLEQLISGLDDLPLDWPIN